MANLKPIRAMGVDPSTKSTGVVILDSNGTKSPNVPFQACFKHPDERGMRRYRELATKVMQTYYHFKPDILVIEGYSLNMKHSSSVVPLVELGAVIRFLLNLDGIQWFDPRATEVKQFVTGKGNSPKDKMMMFVLKNWSFESENNDIADAYACAIMGLAIRNRVPSLTQGQRAVAGKLAIRSF